jgi:hypothetical protein
VGPLLISASRRCASDPVGARGHSSKPWSIAAIRADLAGYTEGEALPLTLRAVTGAVHLCGAADQQEAADAFYQAAAQGGNGVVVLPCGAGKTIVGMVVMAQVQENTLILATSQTSLEQWRRELLDKTDLHPQDVAEYTRERKNTGPVTLVTYQMLTYRPSRDEEFVHFKLFHARSWGLIVYDEVTCFRAGLQITAELQSAAAWLTATLIRRMAWKGTCSRSRSQALRCALAGWRIRASRRRRLLRLRIPRTGRHHGVCAGAPAAVSAGGQSQAGGGRRAPAAGRSPDPHHR